MKIFEIVSYFKDGERRLQVLLLVFVEVERAYKKKQPAINIFIVLDQYHIKDCFSYFVQAHVTSNNCTVSSISDQLFENERSINDSQQHWLKCNSHIINLSVQTFLFW